MSTNRSLSRHSGAILNTQKVAELTVTENAYPPQARLPKHSHSKPVFASSFKALILKSISGEL